MCGNQLFLEHASTPPSILGTGGPITGLFVELYIP
jgi:hypothetical protein